MAERKAKRLALHGENAGYKAVFLAGDPIALGVLVDDEARAWRRVLSRCSWHGSSNPR
jgi:hypothetical protein